MLTKYDEALEFARGMDDIELYLAIHGTQTLLTENVTSAKLSLGEASVVIPIVRQELQTQLRAFNAEQERRDSH